MSERLAEGEVRAYIALGSNLGDPLREARRALIALGSMPETRLLSSSSAYRSHAVGPGTQPDYVNAVAAIGTRLSPLTLLTALKALESRHGRRPEPVPWAPRVIDLDILLYGDLRLATPELTVPHARLLERAFVLWPLAELAPDAHIPGAGPISAHLRAAPRGALTRLSDALW